MRSLLLALFVCVGGVAQQTTTYTTDLNGRPVAGSSHSTAKVGSTLRQTESMQSINGREVPLESVEERVVSEDGSKRVLERIIRRFDANGNPGPAEKQQVEERKNADGSMSSVTSIYRADLNGSYQLSERVASAGSKSGNTTTANVVVERANVNGAFDVAEKQTRVTSDENGSTRGQAVTYRKDISGQFVEAIKVVSNATDQNGQRVENVAQYELGENGSLKLASQTVSRIRKHSDGTETKEIDIFRNVPGRSDPTASPSLQERQLIEQRKQGDRLVETLAVQRPTINDPTHLGPPQKVGEKVCVGKECK